MSQNCLATYSISKRERNFTFRSPELTRENEHILKERMEDHLLNLKEEKVRSQAKRGKELKPLSYFHSFTVTSHSNLLNIKVKAELKEGLYSIIMLLLSIVL